MENNKYKKKKQLANRTAKPTNGYSEGYGYPAIIYENDYNKEKKMAEVEGSFWTPCSKKNKWRHSFCDGK